MSEGFAKKVANAKRPFVVETKDSKRQSMLSVIGSGGPAVEILEKKKTSIIPATI